jgi:uncharacterized protein
MGDSECLAMLMRTPEKGRVKSRLAADLGEEMALELYEAFLKDLITTFGNPADSGGRPLTLFFHPPGSKPAMGRWLRRCHECRPQVGWNLGQRMMNCMKTVLDSFDRCVLIGSDSPDLTREVIDGAFRALDTSDAVLGPSPDGGYYLIGFRWETFSPEVFVTVEWGTDRVLEQTLERFDRVRCRVSLTPPWPDIDRVQDLREFFYRHRHSSCAGSQTMACIRRHGSSILGEMERG